MQQLLCFTCMPLEKFPLISILCKLNCLINLGSSTFIYKAEHKPHTKIKERELL